MSAKLSNQHNQSRIKTRQEVSELKAARRAEIERRAMELQPPLTADVLAHMPSFQAAIKITLPLDDNAWEVLKPRLLASARVEAERQDKRDQEIAAHSRSVPNSETTTVENKQLIDKNWDDAQAPLRTQISAFADEIIQDGWDHGRKVNKENSLHFAADVLLYVRKRFYAEIAKDADAARAAGREPACDSPEGPFTQKLTLENMKWLFDVKIKPHTESFRKELFLCNGCEGNNKIYGFEGVIQHYAAKHTSALSRGSVVVHWRAEWPEIPPFKQDPQVWRNNIQTPSHPQHALGGYSNITMSSSTQPQLAPYNPPLASYGQPTSWDYNIPPPSQPGPNFSQQPIPNHGRGYNAQGASYFPSYPYAGEHLEPQGPRLGPVYSPVGTSAYNQDYHSYQANPQLNFQRMHGPSQGDMFWLQLEELSRNSKDLWASTNGLKDVPGSLRVYVVIYHIAKRFRFRFWDTPPLTMFIHGLSNNKDMRPVRNVNGLMCKACKLSLGNGAPPDEDRTSFSLPQLVNHFQRKHIEPLHSVGAQSLDWTVDMVLVPDISTLSDIRTLPGMDGLKLSLFYEAFPQLQHRSDDVPGVIISAPTNGWANQESHPGAIGHTYGHSTGLVTNSYQAQILPTSQYHATSPQDLTNTYDSSRELAAALEQQKVDAIDAKQVTSQSIAESFTAKSSVAGRLPLDNQGTSNIPNPRSRKKDCKGRQTLSTHSKSRKGAKGSNTPGCKLEVFSAQDQNQGAEEEERRQEEEIRAMWAADRAEAARLVSSTLQPVAKDEYTSEPVPLLVSNLPEEPSPRSALRSDSPIRLARITASPENPIDEFDEEDLTADLVSYLNQQEVSPNDIDQHRGSQNDLIIHTQHPSEGGLSPRSQPIYADDERHSHELKKTRPLPHALHEPHSPSGQLQQQIPTVYYSETSHDSRAPPMAHYDVEYAQRERAPTQGYYRVYSHEPRRLSTEPYAEPYELVRVRNSQGEYYVRRSVGRESTQTYVTYETSRPVYSETPAQSRAYEQDLRFERPMYEAVSRIDALSREQTYLTAGRETSIASQPIHESVLRYDAATLNEYDPRFLTAQSSSNAAHHRQHQR